MGKRGPRPKGKVAIMWSSGFAYAIGLLASDGSLSKNGRHIVLVSAEKEQLVNFQRALDIKVKTGINLSGEGKESMRLQFSDVLFYCFLESIGITSAKSKTIGPVAVPDEYFSDFLRGVFDGDGSSYSYWDRRWKSSFMFYTEFVSASPFFIQWLRNKLHAMTGVRGHISRDGKSSTQQLKYAKRESLHVLRYMYYAPSVICLRRKRLKIERMLRIVGESL